MFENMPFPDIDPVFIDLGFFQIRWYGMAYLGGVALGWLYLLRLCKEKYWPDGAPLTREDVEDLMVWSIVGIVVGGRLGYVLFYQPDVFLPDPIRIFYVWQGGMAFHGGLLGVTVAGLLFCHFREKNALQVADMFACIAPIGLMFGRIANFINGELYGRVSDSDFGMIFPRAIPLGEPRHPSQLYEAFFEGFVLLVLLNILFMKTNLREKPGFLCGVFIGGYGIFRFFIEYFREPDALLGLLWLNLSMGQMLCIPMILVGLTLVIRAQRNA